MDIVRRLACGSTDRGGVGGSAALDLTIVIPASHEESNLDLLLPQILSVIADMQVVAEVLIVTPRGDGGGERAASRYGVRALPQIERGYGGALLEGFRAARGTYVLTMDADLSHPPELIRRLWQARRSADVLIASRYVAGGAATMPRFRLLLSRTLNRAFSRGLSLRVRDMSSGFRLYQARTLAGLQFEARDFDALQEILVLLLGAGWHVEEVPFHYQPRVHGTSNARILRFGLAYALTFGRLWRLRNSILSADYDDRAHDSIIPLQRYWQRERYRHVTELIAGHGPVLDVGCGSSRIIGALPAGSVGVDILLRKLRHARRFGKALACGSAMTLPISDASFGCVLCSQVIEHVPKESPILDELVRVLAPGGLLVLGTPDYDRWEWVLTEALYGWFAPGGYADEHISHYSRAELVRLFEGRGFSHVETRYILRGELILGFRKGWNRP